jgi:two-component system chemotaxis sensor kinase CheA
VARLRLPGSAEAGDSSEITDDEFEALLDQLHGKGNLLSMRWSRPSLRHRRLPRQTPRAGSDLISDHEFESLLDELHGKGKFTEVGTAAAGYRGAGCAAQGRAPETGGRSQAEPAPAPPAPPLPRRRPVPASAPPPKSRPAKRKPPCGSTPRAWTKS